MKQQRLATALLAAFAVSGVCTYLLARGIRASNAPHPVADLMYEAPLKPLEAGQILSAENVGLVAWPGTRPLLGTFTKASDLAGRAMLYPIAQGEPILERAVSAPGAGVGLAAKIPDGMRAIALRSDEVAGVAGFLNPGSHVDVLVTYHSSDSPDPLTATVLEDAQVIAVGQRAQPDPEGKPSPTETVVTLLLSPLESERAVLASSQGTVHFVLRNSVDAGRPSNAPMLLSMLSGVAGAGKRTADEPARVPFRRAAPKSSEIETVFGHDGPEGSAQE